MVGRLGVPRHGLVEDQGVEVGLSGKPDRRPEPGQDNRGPEQQAAPQPEIGDAGPIALESEPGDDREERHDQPDRPLGQGGQAQAGEEQQVGGGAAGAPGRIVDCPRPAVGPEQDGEQFQKGQGHVDLADPSVPHHQGRGQEDRRCQPGGPSAEQPPGEREDDKHGADAREEGRKTGRHLVDAAAQGAEQGDAPEVERRLVVVPLAVQAGHQEVLDGPRLEQHFPRDLGVARFVRVPEVAAADAGQQHGGGCGGEDEVGKQASSHGSNPATGESASAVLRRRAQR